MSICHSLDEENFRWCCRLFLCHSNSLGDGWSWERLQDSEEGYLRKTAVRCVETHFSASAERFDWARELGPKSPPTPDRQRPRESRNSAEADQENTQFCGAVVPGVPDSTEDNNDGDDDFENVEIEDNGVYARSEGSVPVLQYEYHILFSDSYRTPVLYFRVCTLEGQSLFLDDVWGSIHSNYRTRLWQSPWNTITQQEHPFLGQPFFVLHPCRTEEFMGPVLQTAQEAHRKLNYVVTWLSVVGPLVGLELPLSYCTQIPSVDTQGAPPDGKSD